VLGDLDQARGLEARDSLAACLLAADVVPDLGCGYLVAYLRISIIRGVRRIWRPL
jgi:hypothetical protein